MFTIRWHWVVLKVGILLIKSGVWNTCKQGSCFMSGPIMAGRGCQAYLVSSICFIGPPTPVMDQHYLLMTAIMKGVPSPSLGHLIAPQPFPPHQTCFSHLLLTYTFSSHQTVWVASYHTSVCHSHPIPLSTSISLSHSTPIHFNLSQSPNPSPHQSVLVTLPFSI